MAWKNNAQQLVYTVVNPIIDLCIKVGITPNMITFFGFMLNIAAAIVFIFGAEYGARGDHSYVAIAGAIILFAGLTAVWQELGIWQTNMVHYMIQ